MDGRLCNFVKLCPVFYIIVNRLRVSRVSDTFRLSTYVNLRKSVVISRSGDFALRFALFELLKNLVTTFHGTICNLHGHHYIRDIDISARACDSHLKITGHTQIAHICIGPNNTLLFTLAKQASRIRITSVRDKFLLSFNITTYRRICLCHI